MCCVVLCVVVLCCVVLCCALLCRFRMIQDSSGVSLSVACLLFQLLLLQQDLYSSAIQFVDLSAGVGVRVVLCCVVLRCGMLFYAALCCCVVLH